jgi:hypothetical protein
MKRYQLLALLLVLLGLNLAAAFWQLRRTRQPAPVIAESTPEATPEAVANLVLKAPRQIHAGDAWTLNIRAEPGQAGDKVQAVLFNGLRREDAVLILGTGGIAEWQIPARILTQAGQSLAILRYLNAEARYEFQVLPGSPQAVDLLTTANNLTAYGAAKTMLVALPRDAWGNPPPDTLHINASVQFPDTPAQPVNFRYHAGIGWTWLSSQNKPGRVRIQMQLADAYASLELNQVAGSPARIVFAVSPDCALADGRDLVTLTATVTDESGQAVTNGTLVTFLMENGSGSSQTIDGRASLRLPVPTSPGIYHFHAMSAATTSSPASLRVVQNSCNDE